MSKRSQNRRETMKIRCIALFQGLKPAPNQIQVKVMEPIRIEVYPDKSRPPQTWRARAVKSARGALAYRGDSGDLPGIATVTFDAALAAVEERFARRLTDWEFLNDEGKPTDPPDKLYVHAPGDRIRNTEQTACGKVVPGNRISLKIDAVTCPDQRCKGKALWL